MLIKIWQILTLKLILIANPHPETNSDSNLITSTRHNFSIVFFKPLNLIYPNVKQFQDTHVSKWKVTHQ